MAIIAHLDLDAFFASVEEREKPYLKGLPIVVGADPKGGKGRGVVATANYPAREYGIHSAMPISQAWKLSRWARRQGKREAAFISPSTRKYTKASQEVFAIVRKHVTHIEQTSVDEAYLDMNFTETLPRAAVIAREIKRDIYRRTGLRATIGIGHNRMMAKIASSYRKPNGLTVVSEKNAEAFLSPLPIRTIPGIGPKSEETFTKLRIKTIGDARKLSWVELEEHFGKWGFSLYERLRGVAPATLYEDEPPKSIGEHETFDKDTEDFDQVLATLRRMAEHLEKQRIKNKFSGFKTVVLTVRFSDFTTKSRSVTSKDPLTSARALETRAMKLLMPFFDRTENPKKLPIRLVGLRIEKLVA